MQDHTLPLRLPFNDAGIRTKLGAKFCLEPAIDLHGLIDPVPVRMHHQSADQNQKLARFSGSYGLAPVISVHQRLTRSGGHNRRELCRWVQTAAKGFPGIPQVFCHCKTILIGVKDLVVLNVSGQPHEVFHRVR
jgi:hypothetical protein